MQPRISTSFERVQSGAIGGWGSECCIQVDADGSATVWNSRTFQPPERDACRFQLRAEERLRLHRIAATAPAGQDRSYARQCKDELMARIVVERDGSDSEVTFSLPPMCRDEPVPQWADELYAALAQIWRDRPARCPVG